MTTNANEDRKRLSELLTEASELEIELRKQEQQRQMVRTTEISNDFEDKKEFLRNSLRDVYEDIILTDLKKATENKIQEKLWRNIFYNHIEELKQKLSKIKHKDISEYQAAYHELCRYIDLGTGFYHTLFNVLKIRENIDLDRIGIENFLNSPPNISLPNGSHHDHKSKKKELAAGFIQQCLIHLGDLARYRAHIAHQSSDIFGCNDSTGAFVMMDEETKKKGRERFMKAMAQQFLQDQVSSLEQNLQRMNLPSPKLVVPISNDPALSNKESSKPKNFQKLKKCVIGEDVMLNRLNYVKKWASDKKHVVIVPLNVLDSLDLIKKGNSSENARAREAIRFLDQQLLKQQNQSNTNSYNKEQKDSNNNNSNNNNDSFVLVQKVSEKLSRWSCAEEYIINKDEKHENIKQTTDKSCSDDSDDDDDDDDDGDDTQSNDDEEFNVMNIPQEYRSIISCWLYYLHIAKFENVFFVSEDESLIKYAKKFDISVVRVGDV